MDPGSIAFVKGVVAFLLFAGTGMAAYWMRLRARLLSRDQNDLALLRDEHAQLRADLETRIGELEERVDFAERRAVQERSSPRLPGSTARTPV